MVSFLFLPLVSILLPFSVVQTKDVFERRAYDRGSECLKVGVFDPNLHNLQFNLSDTFVCTTVANRKEQLEMLNNSDVLVYVLADKVYDDDANLMKKIVRKTTNLCIVLDSKRHGSISKAFAGFNWMEYNELEGILSIGEINIPVISPPSHLNQTMLMERFREKSRLKIIEQNPTPPINLTGVQSPPSNLIHSPSNATMKDQHVSVVDTIVVSKEDIRSTEISEEVCGPRDIFRFRSESDGVPFALSEERKERTKFLLTDSEYLVNLGVPISLLFVALSTLLLLQKLKKIQHENTELKKLLKSSQEMNISVAHQPPIQQFQQQFKEAETDVVSEKEKKYVGEDEYILNKAASCLPTHITESDEPKILEPIQNSCQEKKYHFMLSYSGDMSKVVQALYKILTDAGYKVWYDKTELYRSAMHDKIAEGINQSVFVVLCLDSSYYKKLRSKKPSGFVKFEFDHAFWNDCYLIPVALEKELKVPSDWKDRSKVRTILCSQGIRELDEWSTLVQNGNEENTNHPQVKAFLEDLLKTVLQFILINSCNKPSESY